MLYHSQMNQLFESAHLGEQWENTRRSVLFIGNQNGSAQNEGVNIVVRNKDIFEI